MGVFVNTTDLPSRIGSNTPVFGLVRGQRSLRRFGDGLLLAYRPEYRAQAYCIVT